jgi:hypothetical protein
MSTIYPHSSSNPWLPLPTKRNVLIPVTPALLIFLEKQQRYSVVVEYESARKHRASIQRREAEAQCGRSAGK